MSKVKPVLWVGSSKSDLMEMPAGVVTDFGYGLYQAQTGAYPDIAKTLSGFGGASVIGVKTGPQSRDLSNCLHNQVC